MTLESDGFWKRVHELLDAREDPLADTAIVEALVVHPERTQPLASMLDSLEAVRALPVEPRVHPRGPASTLRRCAAAAIILVVVGAGYVLARRASAPPTAPPSGPEARLVVRRFAAGDASIVSWTVSVTRREGGATTTDSVGSTGAAIADVSASKHDSDVAEVSFNRFQRTP